MTHSSAFGSQVRLGLVLAIRNRMALIYGFVFPLIFLLAFRVLYRHDEVPLALHLGELLTVTILGGACFGLPTTLVSERERGVWRRYRLTPASPWLFVASALATRMILLLAAALLQLLLALALGMPMPMHLWGLLSAFVVTAATFMGLGLIIAVLSDNVPTVQALGQCIFLPMLIIGGVAVRLSALPDWALHVSAFFPGRYAVAALQANVTGAGITSAGFDVLALTVMGVAAFSTGLRLFRWDADKRNRTSGNKPWLLLSLGAWLLVGLLAVWQGRIAARDAVVEDVGSAEKFALAAPGTDDATGQTDALEWQHVNKDDYKRIAFERLPPDTGLIAPMAAASEQPEIPVAEQLARIGARLTSWPPAHETDPVQRVRNELYVLAVADLLQLSELERFLPYVVLERLQVNTNADDLPRILYWIAMHPDAGDDSAVDQVSQLGLPAVAGPRKALRGRVMVYAFKFLGRLTGNA